MVISKCIRYPAPLGAAVFPETCVNRRCSGSRSGFPSYNLSVSLRSTRPGCGSQRLLRCRSHPAGRCPNSSSLFPPLAAVVAVAPSRGASGETVHFAGTAKASPTRGGGSASALTERLYEDGPALCSKARPFAPYRGSGVQ